MEKSISGPTSGPTQRPWKGQHELDSPHCNLGVAYLLPFSSLEIHGHGAGRRHKRHFKGEDGNWEGPHHWTGSLTSRPVPSLCAGIGRTLLGSPAWVDFRRAFLMSSSVLLLNLISSCWVFISRSFCRSVRALRAWGGGEPSPEKLFIKLQQGFRVPPPAYLCSSSLLVWMMVPWHGGARGTTPSWVFFFTCRLPATSACGLSVLSVFLPEPVPILWF